MHTHIIIPHKRTSKINKKNYCQIKSQRTTRNWKNGRGERGETNKPQLCACLQWQWFQFRLPKPATRTPGRGPNADGVAVAEEAPDPRDGDGLQHPGQHRGQGDGPLGRGSLQGRTSNEGRWRVGSATNIAPEKSWVEKQQMQGLSCLRFKVLS